MKKLVKESLNENLGNYSNDWAIKFTHENQDINAYDLAVFIDENWKEITGLTNRDKDEESYFPNEVEEICDELSVDMDEFSDAWGSVREGSEDWEEDDE